MQNNSVVTNRKKAWMSRVKQKKKKKLITKKMLKLKIRNSR